MPAARSAAASGHAIAAAPMSTMNARRLTWSIGLPPTRRCPATRQPAGDRLPAVGLPHAQPAAPQRGRKVLGRAQTTRWEFPCAHLFAKLVQAGVVLFRRAVLLFDLEARERNRTHAQPDRGSPRQNSILR